MTHWFKENVWAFTEGTVVDLVHNVTEGSRRHVVFCGGTTKESQSWSVWVYCSDIDSSSTYTRYVLSPSPWTRRAPKTSARNVKSNTLIRKKKIVLANTQTEGVAVEWKFDSSLVFLFCFVFFNKMLFLFHSIYMNQQQHPPLSWKSQMRKQTRKERKSHWYSPTLPF